MIRKWTWVAFGLLLLAGAAAAGGFLLDPWRFGVGLLASVTGVCASLGLALLLIDLPKQAQRETIVASAVRVVAATAHEIAWLYLKGFGDWLASELDPQIDMHRDARGHYKQFKALQREVFERVRTEQPPSHFQQPYDDFARTLDWAQEAVTRIRKLMPYDLDARERLKPIARALDRLGLYAGMGREDRYRANVNERFWFLDQVLRYQG